MSQSADEHYDVYDERWVVARQEHTCGACGQHVLPGDRYCRAHVVFDRTATTYKRCARCQLLHEHLRTECPSDEWPDELLGCGHSYEDVHECEPPPEIKKLAFITREEAQALVATRDRRVS